jgi:hypothetical protein
VIISKTILHHVISLFLICVFAFSITPAIVFHDLFSGHSDHDIQHHHKQNSEIAKAGINCHFDNFVCGSSFVDLFTPLIFKTAKSRAFFLIIRNQNFHSHHHFFAELRGPPVFASLFFPVY